MKRIKIFSFALGFLHFKRGQSVAEFSSKSVLAQLSIAILVYSLVLSEAMSVALGATLVSVSITPVAASTDVGQPVVFNSTLMGAVIPYSYVWFLNDTAISETGTSWTFTPSTGGTFSVYLKVYPSVNDTAYNIAQSETAKIIVGGKSFIDVFGYANGSSQASGSGTQYTVDGTRFFLDVESNVTSMSCLMNYMTLPYDPTLNYSYAFAIYSDNNGTVERLIAQTVQGAMHYYDNSGPLWYTLDFPSVVHLSPAAYWLVEVNNGTGQVMISSDVKAGYDSVSSFIGGMTFPPSLPSPIASSNYVFCIYASWAANISASLYPENNDFSIVSNSTVSSLTYNSNSNEVSFNVSGSSGTLGYSEAFISKAILPEVAGATVALDGKQQSFTTASLGDSWVLHFVYLHSKHDVSIGLGENSIPEVPDGANGNRTGATEHFPVVGVAAFVTVIVVSVAAGLLLYNRKCRREAAKA